MKAKRVVSRGRIKVDARRALAKLREHLLLDPDAWALEVVRVAAMCGATGVAVDHDADDLRIAFDGVAPPSASVARLLDFALESSRDPSARSLRLLAVALNAAISTRPRRVTVAVRDEAGEAARFVFDTTLHERDANAGDASEHTLERTPMDVAELGGASVVVEMTKGFSWGTFVRFASQRPLREVLLLREATRRSAIPLTFSPALPEVPREPPVMVVSLERHGVPGGVLAVRPRGDAEPRIEFLEHGVVLADEALPASSSIAIAGHGVHLPVEVHVDADAWPTNASRSQVRAREVATVVEAVHAVLPAIARELGAIMRGEEAGLEGVIQRPSAAQAERAAAMFACCASQTGRTGALAEVLALPLARDAVGRPMSASRLVGLSKRAVESAGAERVFVHRADSPLPEAFAPFAGDVVWLAGSPIDAILRGVHTRDFADVHRDVAIGIARREAWLREPATGPRLEASTTELLRVTIEHIEGAFAGMRGEVAIHVGQRERPGVRIFVDDRMLARVALDGMLPIEAAIAWRGRFRPTLSFDTVVNDASLRTALEEVARVAAAALAARAPILGAADAAPGERALGRAALAADPDSRRGPLAAAALWPTAAGGWTSLAEIAGQTPTPAEIAKKTPTPVGSRVGSGARRPGKIAEETPTPVVEDGAPGAGRARAAPDATAAPSTAPAAIAFVQHPPEDGNAAVPGGRTLLVLDALDAHRLEAALEREIVLVPFGPALGRVDDGQHRPVGDALEKLVAAALEAEGTTRALIVAFRDGPVRGLCATATRGRIIQTFAGIALHDVPMPGELPVIVVLEDERAMPAPGWDRLLHPSTPAIDGALQALLDEARSALGGHADRKESARAVPIDNLGIAPVEPSGLRTWALGALAAVGGVSSRSKVAKALSDLPCVAMLAEPGVAHHETPAVVRRIHAGASIPSLSRPPGFPTMSWRPLLVTSRAEVAVLERALGCQLADSAPECERRLEIFELEQARKRILAQPQLPFAGPLVGAHPLSPTGASPAASKKNSLRAMVALRAGVDPSAARCSLRFNGRHVADVSVSDAPSQLVVVLDTSSAGHIEKWAGISNLGREVAAAAVLDATKAWVAEIIGRSAGFPLEDSLLGTPGACEVIATMLPRAPSLMVHLQDSAVAVESAFGGRVPLSSAWGEGPTAVARRSFPADTASRVAQVPILLEPRHHMLEKLLQLCGRPLHDITRALAEATADRSSPACLPGVPAHPRFRAHFTNLGVDDLDGELEIVEPQEAGIELLVLGDTVRTAAPDMPFGVRAVARPKRIDTRPRAVRELATRIGEAATTLLGRLAPSIETLPPLAAAAVRACVHRAVAAGERPPKALHEAPAFLDVTGRAWSLAQLLRHRLRFTTDDPPYPSTARADKDGPAVLRLDAAFATAVGALGGRGVFDVTRDLRLDAEAEARASAPPVPAVIPPETRRGCFAVGAITDDPVVGQVGLLEPTGGDAAGIAVHRAGRPLCNLGAPPGWPVIAVVDDPGVKANRRHDGLAPTSQADPIVQRVRRQRDELLSALAAAPADAWASVLVERSLLGVDVFGWLWLAEDDPDALGTVRVHWSGRSGDEPQTPRKTNLGGPVQGLSLQLEARDGVPGWEKRLPVSGTLFVAADKPHAPFDGAMRSLLGSVAADALGELLEQKRDDGSPSLPRWRWSAALFGVASPAPAVSDSSGKSRSAAEVVRELRRRGLVWTSRHAGVGDGRFPEEAPSFILLDDGAVPLIDLLESRAPSLVRELGSIAARPEDDDPLQRRRKGRRAKKSRPADGATVEAQEAAPPPPAERTSPEATVASDLPDAPPALTWLARVGSLVSDWTRGAPQQPLASDHPVAVAVTSAAERLGRAAPRVVVAASGRPFVYSPRGDTVHVHLAHPAVESLLGRGEVELLSTAAIGEMNRILECVTDAEETRAVIGLIEQRAARRSNA